MVPLGSSDRRKGRLKHAVLCILSKQANKASFHSVLYGLFIASPGCVGVGGFAGDSIILFTFGLQIHSFIITLLLFGICNDVSLLFLTDGTACC